MPRKSPEALWAENFRAMNAPAPPPYPEAPDYLSERAKEIWRDIVHSKPSTYFDAANQHLLAGFCVSADIADVVHAELNQISASDMLSDPKVRRRYNSLQIMAARQSKLMISLATKLRLLPPRHPPV